MNNERIPSTMIIFFFIKHLDSYLQWWIGSEKKYMVLIFSAKSNNFGMKVFMLIMIRSLNLLYLGDTCIVF